MKMGLLIAGLFLVSLLVLSGCVKNEPSNGAYCIELIGDDTCYHKEDLTCEQMCTKTIWSQEEVKKFTTGEYSSEACKHVNYYNEEPVASDPPTTNLSGDIIMYEPGTIVVNSVYYGGGTGLKDNPPNKNKECCCDK